ncbi:MAG: hypothetical protein ACAH09_06105 [Methylophilaceae bacterium]|nr:hypothetical protein [Methylophilaceae bacterium]
MRHAVRQNEYAKNQEYPAMLQILAEPDEIGESGRDGVTGKDDQKMGERVEEKDSWRPIEGFSDWSGVNNGEPIQKTLQSHPLCFHKTDCFKSIFTG